MAQSDSFFPTKSEALAHIRRAYGTVKLQPEQDATGWWKGYEQSEGADGFDVHLSRETIEITRAGLCRALALIPNR